MQNIKLVLLLSACLVWKLAEPKVTGKLKLNKEKLKNYTQKHLKTIKDAGKDKEGDTINDWDLSIYDYTHDPNFNWTDFLYYYDYPYMDMQEYLDDYYEEDYEETVEEEKTLLDHLAELNEHLKESMTKHAKLAAETVAGHAADLGHHIHKIGETLTNKTKEVKAWHSGIEQELEERKEKQKTSGTEMETLAKLQEEFDKTMRDFNKETTDHLLNQQKKQLTDQINHHVDNVNKTKTEDKPVSDKKLTVQVKTTPFVKTTPTSAEKKPDEPKSQLFNVTHHLENIKTLTNITTEAIKKTATKILGNDTSNNKATKSALQTSKKHPGAIAVTITIFIIVLSVIATIIYLVIKRTRRPSYDRRPLFTDEVAEEKVEKQSDDVISNVTIMTTADQMKGNFSYNNLK